MNQADVKFEWFNLYSEDEQPVEIGKSKKLPSSKKDDACGQGLACVQGVEGTCIDTYFDEDQLWHYCFQFENGEYDAAINGDDMLDVIERLVADTRVHLGDLYTTFLFGNSIPEDFELEQIDSLVIETEDVE